MKGRLQMARPDEELNAERLCEAAEAALVAAVEAGLALGLVILLYRRRGSLDSEAWAAMSG